MSAQHDLFAADRAVAMPSGIEYAGLPDWDVHIFPSPFAAISEKSAKEGLRYIIFADTADEACWKAADDLLRVYGIKHAEVVSVERAA